MMGNVATWVLLVCGVLTSGRAAAVQLRLLHTGARSVTVECLRSGQAADLCAPRSVLVGLPLEARAALTVLHAEGETIPVPEEAPQEDWLGAASGPAIVKDAGFVRGQRAAELVFLPRSNGDGTLTVYPRVVVRVEFQGAPGAGGGRSASAAQDPWGERLLRELVINYDQARSWRRSYGGSGVGGATPGTAAPRPAQVAAPRPAQVAAPVLVRVNVSAEGMYRITGDQLRRAGIRVLGFPSSQLHMYYGGGRPLPEDSRGVRRVEVPVIVEDGGDGRFDTGDDVLFYGQAPSRWIYDSGDGTYLYQQNLYTRTNVYWIGVGGPGEGVRAAVAHSSHVPLPAPGDTLGAYRERLHEEREKYVSVQTHDISSGYEWYWESFSGNARRFPVRLDAVVGDSADIVLGFQAPSLDRSNFLVRWNDHEVREISVPGHGKSRARLHVAAGVRDGTNYLGLYHSGGAPVRLDYYEVEYSRRLAARRGWLRFDGPSCARNLAYRMTGFPGRRPRIFEVSAGLREIVDAVCDSASGTVLFRDVPGPGPRRYLVLTRENWSAPDSLELDTPSRLRSDRGGAEYVIITHREFSAAARRLGAWRSADRRFGAPLSTEVVDVQDVYDEFSGGMVDPTAVRAFLRWAYENWAPAPFFVLLMGDGTYDYKNNSGVSPHVWIPAYQHEESTYDEWFVCVSGDDLLPDMAIGRLPVATPEDADFVVDRVIGYDQDPPAGPWQARGLLVADDIHNPNHRLKLEPFFLMDAEALARRSLPRDLNLRKLYLAQYPLEGHTKPRARAEFLRQFNAGDLYVTYVGHGNPDVLAHEQMFVVSRDLGEVDNGKRLPFFFTAASQVGVFDDPMKISMPEALLLRRQGGVIGMICATRVGFHTSNMWLAQAFHRLLFDVPERYVPVGLALMEAKREVQIPDPGNDQINIRRYSLFGDPAQRLALPRYRVALSVPDTLRALEEVTIHGQVQDRAGRPVTDYQGQAWVQAFDSAVLSRLDGYAYRQLGAPMFRGRYPVHDGQVSASFRVPKDITYHGRDGRVSMYVWDDPSPRGCGASWGIVLAGTASGAPQDRTGPSIRLGIAGQGEVRDGVEIPPGAVLQVALSDPGGINVTGATGHQIELRVDGEIHPLTDRFSADGDFRRGSLEYPLPALEPGPHELVVKAWDVYNNSATATLHVRVSGHADALLTRVLFHPNPLRGDTGYFTFDLALPALRVRIRIFTLSGRLVDEVESGVQVGYNQVAWRADADLANGAYVYQIRVLREDGSRPVHTGVLEVIR